MIQSEKLQRLNQSIDEFNRNDPHRDLVDGIPVPHELAYSERLTNWVLKLNPSASEALLIAARGQHIGRWTIPRQTYPMNRGGYLRWREELKKFHAEKLTELMRAADYRDDIIQKVRAIVLKKEIKSDPDTQTLEDALCLVFLETQFKDLKAHTSEEKMIGILRKTWGKMSSQGRQAAGELAFDPEEKRLLTAALEHL